MRITVIVLLVLIVTGCAAPNQLLRSANTNMLVIGERPAGYPKTYIDPYKGFPGYCLKVTESWRKGSYNDKTIWLKDKAIESMRCPGQR